VVEALIPRKVEIVPAPRKFIDEMKERAKRRVREARPQEPGLSVNAACTRIGLQLDSLPDSLRGRCKQAGIDDGSAPGTPTAESEELKAAVTGERQAAAGNEILKAAPSTSRPRGSDLGENPASSELGALQRARSESPGPTTAASRRRKVR
jgi:transposase